MGTNIRPIITKKNKYWISRHRYYELKHFCLQYLSWRKAYATLTDMIIYSPVIDKLPSGNTTEDPTAKYAIVRASYYEKMKMVEQAAIDADFDLQSYILRAVTEELSYNYLKASLDMPCSKDTYYDRYRRFFWCLDKLRD